MKPSSLIDGRVLTTLDWGVELITGLRQAAVIWFFFEPAVMGVASRRWVKESALMILSICLKVGLC